MDLNNDKIFKLYTLTELNYQKHFRNTVNNIEELYPECWYETKNYKLKIEILYEAIKNNILIVDTFKYKEMIEGIEKDYVKQIKNQ